MKKCFSWIVQLWKNGLIPTPIIIFLTIGLMIVGGFSLSSYLQDSQRAQFVETLMQGREPTELMPNQIQNFSASNEIKPICLTLNPRYHHLVGLGNQISIQRSNGVLSIFFPEAAGEWMYNASVSGTLFRSDNQPLDRKDELRPCYPSSGAGTQRWTISSKIREFWYWASYETSS